MKVDVLISGMGLAGTVLAETLIQRGKSVAIFDPCSHVSPSLPNNLEAQREEKLNSSRIAAGIFNPINQKRFAPHWKFDEFYAKAMPFYQNIEIESGPPLLHLLPSYHIFKDAGQQNDWLTKGCEPHLMKYISPNPKIGLELVRQPFEGVSFNASGFVNTQALIEQTIDRLTGTPTSNNMVTGWRPRQPANHFINEKLDFAKLEINTTINYQNIEAESLVLCNGFADWQNPYFPSLPFYPSKGEILTLEIPDFSTDCILHNGVYLVPIENGVFKCGATYNHINLNDAPSEEGKAWLTKHLNNLLKIPYKIINHLAAVRPTVKDRRPLLGKSLTHNNVFMLNGLGTKGVLMAPLLADLLCSHIFDGLPLPKEMDIARFY